jgi:hypothetical protein
MDSNHRSPVKDQLVETVLFGFSAEARKRTIGGRRSQPRDLGGDLRRTELYRTAAPLPELKPGSYRRRCAVQELKVR